MTQLVVPVVSRRSDARPAPVRVESAVFVSVVGLEEIVRQRAPSLLAAARRILEDDAAARCVVEEAMIVAREVLPLFRVANPGTWIQGLVVGLAVARTKSAT